MAQPLRSHRPVRYARRVGTVTGIVGAVTGLIVGLIVHAQTAVLAIFELGIPSLLAGLVLGSMIGLFLDIAARGPRSR